MKLNPPLLALAAGAFGIGVTEFAPMGLLPVIATDLGVSIPAAGLLVSAYALTSSPAAGIETPRSLAITGSRPIGANSVTPMPNAPAASASNGGLSFMAVLSVQTSGGFRRAKPSCCR